MSLLVLYCLVWHLRIHHYLGIAKQICHMANTSTPERAHVHHTGFITPDCWVAIEEVCTRTRQSLLGQINTELVMSSKGGEGIASCMPGASSTALNFQYT